MRKLFLSGVAAALVGCGSGSVASTSSGPTSGNPTNGTGSGSSTGTGTAGGASSSGSTTGAAKLSAGAACSSDSACESDVCGVTGEGHCCAQKCTTSSSAICGATECDATGACTYAASGTACDHSCSAGSLTQSVCDGSGNCSGAAAPCPGHFACQDATSCKTSCAGDSDCGAAFYCSGGACLPQLSAGPCSANDMCSSGICGLNGSGNCCAAACSTADSYCGATACDAVTAACDYPAATSPCGVAVPECSADGSEGFVPSHCDGAGNCPNSQFQCAPYICSGVACLKSCTSSADCDTFCDTSASTCCSVALSQGSSLRVDAVTGSDQQACCGIGTNPPCQSLGHALKIIDEARAKGVDIYATVDGGPGTWPTGVETYPVVLGWGAELFAPSIAFSAATAAPELFDIAAVSAQDTVGSASIVGSDSASEVSIGNGPELGGIRVEGGNALYLAGAEVNGSPTSKATAITVAAGGKLTLGQDQSTQNNGTVYIGSANGTASGWNGIICETGNQKGCTIQDVAIGESALTMTNQENVGLDAEDFASISLTSSPVIGVAPVMAGFNGCPSKIDQSQNVPGPGAIYLNGRVDLTFSNGTLQCLAKGGFWITNDNAYPTNGNPVVKITSSTIQSTDYGIYANAGTVTVASTVVQFNFVGVWQDLGEVAIDLDGADAGSNTVICSSNAYFYGRPSSSEPQGVSVFNSSTDDIDADNLVWDTAGPDTFACQWSGGTDIFSDCTCTASTCTVTPDGDGMDAVTSDTGAISTKGGSQSAVVCSPSN